MAIIGMGTDIVEIARIAVQLERSGKLAQRILTSEELAFYKVHNEPARYLAKRFAAKEAAVKALGTGIGNGVGWQHIRVLNHPGGAPYLLFSDGFASQCKERGIIHSHVSISDEQHYAVATVILEN